jgi:hypothetical protein
MFRWGQHTVWVSNHRARCRMVSKQPQNLSMLHLLILVNNFSPHKEPPLIVLSSRLIHNPTIPESILRPRVPSGIRTDHFQNRPRSQHRIMGLSRRPPETDSQMVASQNQDQPQARSIRSKRSSLRENSSGHMHPRIQHPRHDPRHQSHRLRRPHHPRSPVMRRRRSIRTTPANRRAGSRRRFLLLLVV